VIVLMGSLLFIASDRLVAVRSAHAKSGPDSLALVVSRFRCSDRPRPIERIHPVRWNPTRFGERS